MWLSSWIKDGGHLPISIEAYFDGSYVGKDWRDGGFVTLAGFAATDLIWRDFDKEWSAILNDDTRGRPKAPYLHMRELAALEGPFNFRNGWNLKRTQVLINDLLMYLQKIDKKRFRTFACTIDLEAYRKVKAEGLVKLDDPIDICNDKCPATVLGWMSLKEYYPDLIHSAHYFFDKDEPFKERFEKRWITEKENYLPASGSHYFWSIIKSVAITDMRDHPALQAADLLAWASNRKAAKKGADDSFANLEPFMKLLLPTTWSFWGEDELRIGRMKKF